MSKDPVTDWELSSAINHVECDLMKLSKRADVTDLERALFKVAKDVLTDAWMSAYERQKAAEHAKSQSTSAVPIPPPEAAPVTADKLHS